VTQAVLPKMRERRSGRIVMISSVSGLVTPPTQGAYSASKHAMEGLSNALRHELYPFGVKTILIEPGYIVTNIQETAVQLVQPYQEKIRMAVRQSVRGLLVRREEQPRKVETTPEDCARVILKAIQAPAPQERYGVNPAGHNAQMAKRLLPDSVIDAMIRRRYESRAKSERVHACNNRRMVYCAPTIQT